MNSDTTCVINVLDGEAFILDAIQSARSQIYPCDILVCDNQSSDSTRSLALKSGVRVISTDNRMTLGEARNFSLKFVETKFVSWLDVDDLWHESFLENTVKELKKNPHIGLASASCIITDLSLNPYPRRYQIFAEDNRFEPIWEGDTREKIRTKLRCMSSWHAYVFRSKYVRKVGGFNGDLKYATDVDIILKVSSVSKTVHINKNLTIARQHDKQETNRLTADRKFNEIFSCIEKRGLPIDPNKKRFLLSEGSFIRKLLSLKSLDAIKYAIWIRIEILSLKLRKLSLQKEKFHAQNLES